MEHTKIINGERHVSTVGVVLLALHGWRTDHKEPCREALRRYCQYLAMHGYGKGSKAIWEHLAGMDNQEAAQWVETTFRQFVTGPVAAVEYVLGTVVQCQ